MSATGRGDTMKFHWTGGKMRAQMNCSSLHVSPWVNEWSQKIETLSRERMSSWSEVHVGINSLYVSEPPVFKELHETHGPEEGTGCCGQWPGQTGLPQMLGRPGLLLISEFWGLEWEGLCTPKGSCSCLRCCEGLQDFLVLRIVLPKTQLHLTLSWRDIFSFQRICLHIYL